jgi:hypothetical protein
MHDITQTCRDLSQQDMNDYIKWRDDPNPNKPYRGPAAEQNDFRKNDQLEPFFAKNGMVFKNINL